MKVNSISRILALAVLAAGTCVQAQENKRPDVVLIVVDDLNDYVGCLGGYPQGVSPNLDALAKSGMLFSQAYCNAPQCGPSRASFNRGIYPFRTGKYFNRTKGNNKRDPNAKPVNKAKPSPLIQQFFMHKGYRVASGGKVLHGGPGRHGDELLQRPKDPKPPRGKNPFNTKGSPVGYALDCKDEEMGDYKVASWGIEQWRTASEKPLFMSIGFRKPHPPLQVPKRWFDKFPAEKIKRPAEPAQGDDWDDMPEFACKLARSHAHKRMHKGMSDHEAMIKAGKWDETIQAYLACIAFVDDQIGRLLDALKNNPRGRDTVIMLVSDHGWNLGEKKHWAKAAIWEQTTRIPFIVKAPGVEPGSVCPEPVSLVDVYPSLVDLAGIEVPGFLDGKSVRPQLRDPGISRDPVISNYGHANTAIRSRHWRYIRYEDNSEELYNHRNDPNEWNNLADLPEYESVKQKLAESIPENPVPNVLVQGWFDNYQPGPLKAENKDNKQYE